MADIDCLLNKFSAAEVEVLDFDVDLAGPRLPTKHLELGDLRVCFMMDAREKTLYLHYGLYDHCPGLLYFELRLFLDYGGGRFKELAISPDRYWRIFEMDPKIVVWSSCNVRCRKVPRALRILLSASVNVDHNLASLSQKSFILSSDCALGHKLALLDSHVGTMLFPPTILRYLICSCNSETLGKLMASDVYGNFSPKLKTLIAERHRQLTTPRGSIHYFCSFNWFY